MGDKRTVTEENEYHSLINKITKLLIVSVEDLEPELAIEVIETAAERASSNYHLLQPATVEIVQHQE